MPATLWTLGHSNVALDDFIALASAFDLAALADIRTLPTSRRHPHFARDSLERELPARGLEYRWFRELGGLRKPRKNSPHVAWRVEGFRGYADYMETPEFERALAELLAWAGDRRVAYFCSERLWWQCHRRVLSDRLVTRGYEIFHILSPTKAEPHRLSEFARLDGDRIVYDADLLGGSA